MKLSLSLLGALALVVASGSAVAASCKEDAQRQWPRFATRAEAPTDEATKAQLDEAKNLLRQAQKLCNARDEAGAQAALTQVKSTLQALGR